MNKYIRSFVIGSSLPVFSIFFKAVQNYEKQGIINYSYYNYSLIAPLYLGIMNIIAYIIRTNFGLSLKQSLLLISIISSMIVMVFITINNAYNFQTRERWILQYQYILFAQLFVFNVIIYLLELTIAN